MKNPVAIDARLVGGSSTGDSTYWTGLVHGLFQTAPRDPLVFISNTEKPEEIPWSDGWRWINVPASSERWWSLVSFPLAARRAGAKAVHTQYNLSPLVRRGGIVTLHDVSFFIGPEWFGGKDRMLLQRFVPASVKRSARVISVSNTGRAEIEHFISAAAGKTVVIPEAAAPWIRPMPPAEAKWRVAELIGQDEPYVFALGTSWARKNQGLAVAAVAGLRDGPVLYLGGKGLAEAGVSDRVRRLGYVSQDDLSALYSGAEAHVLPSLHEGFGLTVLEAFTCGCPVLCGAGGALPEIAGDAAVIVPNYEPQAWTAALERMLSSNLDDLRERGRRRAAEFSWTTTAHLTRQVYREVANP